MNSTALISRINGLDTLRACAILLVLMFHYMVFVSHEPSFGILSEIGWMGVDLFFVLSGYLIANQIFATMKREGRFSLGVFYVRRALRTLPNFYVVLAVYFLFPLAVGGNPVTPLWKFLTFTQNFDLRAGSAFSHAWSLSIEEQFYLVLPLLALFVFQLKKSIRLAWIIMGTGMLVAIIFRYLMWREVGDDRGLFYVKIYYSTWCRFDELLPGVALALLKNFHPENWDALKRHGQKILMLGLALTVFSVYLFSRWSFLEGQGYLMFTTVFGYTLLSTGFACLVVAALSPATLLYKLRIPGAASLALWSYALYLVHKPLMNVLIHPFVEMGIAVTSVLGISLMFSVSIFVAWILFTVVETPFMRLRDRHFGRSG